MLNNKSTLSNWLHKITDILSFSFFIGVCGLFTYLIFDLETRASIEFGWSPWVILGISVLLIIFVAILEGSQIAIINLADKDQSEFCDKKIHTNRIINTLDTKDAIHHYLIGRQLLVVVSVIVFSLLTSFPHMRNHELGAYLPQIVDMIVFKLGLINALVLLWFGQLIPQLIAHRAPQKLLNFWIVRQVIHLCIFFSHLKIAKPSSVVANQVELESIKPHSEDIQKKTR
jgi:hypothetical protein